MQPNREVEEPILLEEHYLLRVRTCPEGVEGDVLMRDLTRPGQATHLFEAPRQQTQEELKAWAQLALRAYREG